MLYVDAMASFWREWIINYDLSHQHALGRQATQSVVDWLRLAHDWTRREYDALLAAARRSQQTISDAPLNWTLGALGTATLIILGANAQRIWRVVSRRRIAARPNRYPTTAATIWYRRSLHLLARKGFRKLPAQTPEEFLCSIADERFREPISRLTEYYERARFGASSEDAVRLPEVFEELSKLPRK